MQGRVAGGVGRVKAREPGRVGRPGRPEIRVRAEDCVGRLGSPSESRAPSEPSESRSGAPRRGLSRLSESFV